MGQPLSNGRLLNGGRYKIEKRLGSGGMGTVYLAADTSSPGQYFAIKENVGVTTRVQQQFRREAEVLARLDHPNLPSITDYFVEESHRQYLVMDYIDGENLRDILTRRSEPLNQQEIMPWVEQIMDALTYMHTWFNRHTGKINPIIHRDIKPGNIKRASDGKIYLVDFGIAKVDITNLDELKDDGYRGIYGETPMPTNFGTVTGARAFSAGYSPVEQYTGGTDVRTDVYALGATLYTLVTNRVPPEAPNIAVGRTLYAPRQFNPGISRQMERVILKAMSIQPAYRFESIEAMRKGLHSRWYGNGLLSTLRRPKLKSNLLRGDRSLLNNDSDAGLPIDPVSEVSTDANPHFLADGTPSAFSIYGHRPSGTNTNEAVAPSRFRQIRVWALFLALLFVATTLALVVQLNQSPIIGQTAPTRTANSGAANSGIVSQASNSPTTAGEVLASEVPDSDPDISPEKVEKEKDGLDPESSSPANQAADDRQESLAGSATGESVSNSAIAIAGGLVTKAPTSTPLVPTQTATSTQIAFATSATSKSLSSNTLSSIPSDGTPTRAPTPTPTTTPTVTDTRTSTPSPTPSPTLKPTVTKTPTGVATWTPSWTPTNIPTNTPTATSATLAEQSDIVAATPTALAVTYNNIAMTLLEPRDPLLRGQYIFKWQTDLVLQPGQAFEVVLWQEGTEPMVAGLGPVAAGQYTEVRVDLDVAIDRIPQLSAGRPYRWGVLLVEANPYRRVAFLGSSHQFQLERSGGQKSAPTPAPRG